ncbi:MAG: hypothetical protein CME19_08000 [Gemmatimonadetes bacterium]|nr:hypothetical protein [Gemmatimonadota bacterium]
MARMIKQYLLPLVGTLLVSVPVEPQTRIPLDMSQGWVRRDWDDCEDPSRMSSSKTRLQIETEQSAALYWQVPTKGGPLEIDRDQGWVADCDRPPSNFARTVAKGANLSRLLDVSEFRYFSWNWKVSNTIDDSETIDEKGRIQEDGDDFAAKIGISIIKKGSDSPREISYVWTRNLPEETVLVHEKKILFWRFRYHRIVAESGDARKGQWVSEARDLCADYKRIYPDEEPGRIVRIYVMSDSDNTSSRVTGSFSDLTFSSERPPGLSSSE